MGAGAVARRAEAGQGRDSSSGAAMPGPRRLKTSMASRRPDCGVQDRRSGAGLPEARDAGARKAISGVAPDCAARCSRRNVASSTGRSLHHSTAAQLPERRVWSAAQAASARRAGLMHSSCAGASPSACNAAMQGRPGGEIQTSSRGASSRWVRPRSQGASKDSSPLAGIASSSVMPANGQPPPGSSASSAGQPVDAVGRLPRASWPARHKAASRPGGRLARGATREKVGLGARWIMAMGEG